MTGLTPEERIARLRASRGQSSAPAEAPAPASPLVSAPLPPPQNSAGLLSTDGPATSATTHPSVTWCDRGDQRNSGGGTQPDRRAEWAGDDGGRGLDDDGRCGLESCDR